MASGDSYERFFADELMPHVETAYRAKQVKSWVAVCGVGSGGYAALRYALAYPYWFGSAVALSGEIDLTQEEKTKESLGPETAHRLRRVFGDPEDPRRKSDNLYALAARLDRGQAPDLMLSCGQDDPSLAQNREFHRRLSSLRIRHDFSEHPGGGGWEFWNSRLPAALAFIERNFGS
jgi:S-formylglutathione hydrolase FrmB